MQGASKLPAFCLEESNSPANNGVQVQTNTCNDGSNQVQVWNLVFKTGDIPDSQLTVTSHFGRRRLRDQAPSRMEISTRRSRHISDVIVEVINSNSHILIDICRIKYLKAKSKLHLVWYITTQWQPKVMSTGEHFRIYLC